MEASLRERGHVHFDDYSRVVDEADQSPRMAGCSISYLCPSKQPDKGWYVANSKSHQEQNKPLKERYRDFPIYKQQQPVTGSCKHRSLCVVDSDTPQDHLSLHLLFLLLGSHAPPDAPHPPECPGESVPQVLRHCGSALLHRSLAPGHLDTPSGFPVPPRSERTMMNRIVLPCRPSTARVKHPICLLNTQQAIPHRNTPLTSITSTQDTCKRSRAPVTHRLFNNHALKHVIVVSQPKRVR